MTVRVHEAQRPGETDGEYPRLMGSKTVTYRTCKQCGDMFTGKKCPGCGKES